MSEIDWSRYPSITENKLARRWLRIQRDLGLAQNTVEAYGRALEEYLRFVRVLRADPTHYQFPVLCVKRIIGGAVRLIGFVCQWRAPLLKIARRLKPRYGTAVLTCRIV